MNFLKLCVVFFLFVTNKSLALDITVNIPIYKPLSKSLTTSIPGSSNIILTKKDLIKYSNSSINEIIDKEAGIKNRSIYGNNSSGSKSTIDIRGMGAQAKSNVLILINGQRLNNIDMSEIDFPSIPIESIDRIEIFKGNSATVLYGDGAIGGAINIITNPEINKTSKNKIIYKNGSFNNNEIIWNNNQNYDNYNISTYFNHTETDGYRDENEQQQNNFTSEIRFPRSNGDHFIAASFSEQIMSTPSDRSQDQLYTDRKGSDTPDDFVNSEGGSLLYSSNYQLKDNLDLVFNSSFRIKDSYSDLQSTAYPSYSDTTLTNYQLTPRINHISSLFGKNTKSNYGIDIQYADYKSLRKKNKKAIPLHRYYAWQSTQSIYAQQSLEFDKYTKLGLGFRAQRNEIAIGDILNTNAPDYSGWQTEHETFLDDEINYALNLGFETKINNNTLIYGRLGNGFRYPNIDDRIGGSGGTSLNLKTQKSNDLEIGSKFDSENFFSNFSFFVIDSENELAYDSDAFENINVNSTRRFGFELKTTKQISKKLIWSNNYTFLKAKYTSENQGTYATDFNKNDIPLVPENSLDSILKFNLSDSTKLISSIKYQDDMRMESDDENFQDTKIPNYIIANIDLKSKLDYFFFTISVNNLLNTNYHNYAVASSSTIGTYNAYPEPGREIIISIGSEF